MNHCDVRERDTTSVATNLCEVSVVDMHYVNGPRFVGVFSIQHGLYFKPCIPWIRDLRRGILFVIVCHQVD